MRIVAHDAASLRRRTAPASMRHRFASLFALVVPSVLVCLVAFRPTSARAGYYAMTWDLSNTAETNDLDGATWNETYFLPDPSNSQFNVHTDPNAMAAPQGPGDEWDITCSGPIVARYTWVPNPYLVSDPAPQSVIVSEQCTASWTMFSGSGSSASCSDGFGDPEVDDPDGYSGTSTGFRYSLQSGSSFTVTCSPQVVVDCFSYGLGIPNINYTVSVYPVILQLNGTVSDDLTGAPDILIGQGCQASLACAPFVQFSGYSWNVPGATTWQMSMAQDQSSGGFIPIPSSNWSSAMPYWFWYQGGAPGSNGLSTTITCSATATCTDGTGAQHSLGGVSATNTCYVWEPYSQMINGLTLGPTSADNAAAGTVSTGGPATDPVPGIELGGSVGTPAQFLNTEGYGMWAWLQLCKLDRTVFPTGDGSVLPDYYLDSAFPYNTAAGQGDVPDTPTPADSTGTSHRYYGFTDTPLISFGPDDSSVLMGDQFKLYMMFAPPDMGYGTTWVPIRMGTWGDDINTSRTSSLSGWSNWDPNPPGHVYYGGDSTDPGLPGWDNIFLSGN